MAPSEGKRGFAALNDDNLASNASDASSPSTTTSKRRARRENSANEDDTTTRNSIRNSRRSPARARTPESGFTRVVTPSQANKKRAATADNASTTTDNTTQEKESSTPKTKRRLAFGRVILETPCQKNVQDVYRLVAKLTGSVGGNGSFGAICTYELCREYA